MKNMQVNIEAVRLGDIIDGQEVVTILDRQDYELVKLSLTNDETIAGRYGRTITVQR